MSAFEGFLQKLEKIFLFLKYFNEANGFSYSFENKIHWRVKQKHVLCVHKKMQ